MKKNGFIIAAFIIAALAIGAAFTLGGESRGDTAAEAERAVSVREDGTQIVTILARGGYSPREAVARAGVPTVLRIETRGTFDCSAALVIPALSVQEFLPPSGVREYEVPPQNTGATIDGSCSMGMYGFRITFE